MSALYDPGREGFLDGTIDWDTNTIKAQLLSATYTFSGAHKFRSSITGTVGTAVTLGSKTVTNGVADAADAVFTAVTGSAVNAVYIYADNGSAATDRLIAYIDGISVTPNGGDITVSWDNGVNKIFKL